MRGLLASALLVLAACGPDVPSPTHSPAVVTATEPASHELISTFPPDSERTDAVTLPDAGFGHGEGFGQPDAVSAGFGISFALDTIASTFEYRLDTWAQFGLELTDANGDWRTFLSVSTDCGSPTACHPWMHGYPVVHPSSETIFVAGSIGPDQRTPFGSTSREASGGFVMASDNAGHVLWNQMLGGVQGQTEARAIAANSAPEFVVAGIFSGDPWWGEVAAGGSELHAFLAVFGTDGVLRWAKDLGPCGDTPMGVARFPDGTIVWGGATPSAAGSNATSPTLLGYSPAGEALWSKALSADGFVSAVAVGPTDGWVATGRSVPFHWAGEDLDPDAAFVVAGTSAGAESWGHGGTGVGTSISTNGAHVVLTVDAVRAPTFRLGTHEVPVPDVGSGIATVALDPNGTVRWAHVLLQAGDRAPHLTGSAMLPEEHVAIAGQFSGPFLTGTADYPIGFWLTW